MVYKSSELLLLLSIGFKMEPHLGLLLWTLVEVGSFLGSPQQVISEPIVRSARPQRCGMVDPMDELGEVTRKC